MPAHELQSPLRRRSLALLTCTGLALTGLGPQAAFAAPAEPVEPVEPVEPAVAAAEEPETNEAEKLFRQGQANYETADYTGAIELWTKAYALVEPTPENAGIKAVLLYNVAQAHVKAYALYEDPVHLKKALQLLQGFREGIPVLYSDEAARAEETAKVEARIAEIEESLEAHEAKTEGPAQPDAGEQAPVEPPPPKLGAGRKLKITGSIFVGLGGVSLIVGAVGLVAGANANDIDDLDDLDLSAREERFTAGRRANAAAFVGFIAGGVLLPVGAALIAVGNKRNKAAKGATARAVLVPTFSRDGAGLSLTGRF